MSIYIAHHICTLNVLIAREELCLQETRDDVDVCGYVTVTHCN